MIYKRPNPIEMYDSLIKIVMNFQKDFDRLNEIDEYEACQLLLDDFKEEKEKYLQFISTKKGKVYDCIDRILNRFLSGRYISQWGGLLSLVAINHATATRFPEKWQEAKEFAEEMYSPLP